MKDPTDDELLKLYCLAEGDLGSYAGWLAIYQAGAKAGMEDLLEEIESEGPMAGDDMLDKLKARLND